MRATGGLKSTLVTAWVAYTKLCFTHVCSKYNAVLVQALLQNKQSDPVEKLLAPCRQQPASDQMVLFVRAITAAACLQSHGLSLEIFSSSLRADGLQCKYVLSQSSSVCICCICFVPAHGDMSVQKALCDVTA